MAWSNSLALESMPHRAWHSPCHCRLTECGGSTMEDKTTSEVLHDKAFFGVYDGHGGRQAAELCQENLHKHLMRERV